MRCAAAVGGRCCASWRLNIYVRITFSHSPPLVCTRTLAWFWLLLGVLCCPPTSPQCCSINARGGASSPGRSVERTWIINSSLKISDGNVVVDGAVTLASVRVTRWRCFPSCSARPVCFGDVSAVRTINQNQSTEQQKPRTAGETLPLVAPKLCSPALSGCEL